MECSSSRAADTGLICIGNGTVSFKGFTVALEKSIMILCVRLFWVACQRRSGRKFERQMKYNCNPEEARITFQTQTRFGQEGKRRKRRTTDSLGPPVPGIHGRPNEAVIGSD